MFVSHWHTNFYVYTVSICTKWGFQPFPVQKSYIIQDCHHHFSLCCDGSVELCLSLVSVCGFKKLCLKCFIYREWSKNQALTPAVSIGIKLEYPQVRGMAKPIISFLPGGKIRILLAIMNIHLGAACQKLLEMPPCDYEPQTYTVRAGTISTLG